MIIESHYADVFGNSSTNIVKTADYTHRQLIIARKDSCYIKVPPQLLTNLTTSFGISNQPQWEPAQELPLPRMLVSIRLIAYSRRHPLEWQHGIRFYAQAKANIWSPHSHSPRSHNEI